jgi:2-polyprenyl-3-methyl-5-hydroxy-6-metoxy-1,4-benzoquinol methylase
MNKTNLKKLSTQTKNIYETHAQAYDQQRSRALVEQIWLERFLELLPEKASILDAGCGAGEPIDRYLIEKGHDITGIDFSQALIDMAQERFPDHEWVVADMAAFNLQTRFEGILAWHSFFHLTPDAQREAIGQFASHLKPGGILMVTVGPEAGEVIGHVNAEPVYHASLSLEGYKAIFENLNMEIIRFVANDPDCDSASVLIARKF